MKSSSKLYSPYSSKFLSDSRFTCFNLLIFGLIYRVLFRSAQVRFSISCQGRGCHAYFPEYTYILDLGGQDAKVIKKSTEGKIVQFIMNDKCAAGIAETVRCAYLLYPNVSIP